MVLPRFLLLIAALASLGGCADAPPWRAVRVATGSVSHTLCSAVFLSGRNPDQAYREEMRPETGMGLIDWALRYDVDRTRREVTTTVAGRFESRAVYRDGLGCLLLRGDPPADAPLPAAPAVEADERDAGTAPVDAADPRIRAAIDAAFAEPGEGTPRHTHAVVVVHGGRVIGERYAPGIGPRTPWHGHSVSKSVANALVGVLVRQGRLAVDRPAPVAEWQQPGDPRAAVTVDQLLRMTSGLPFDETAGGWDAASRMWHIERDMAAYAAQGELESAPGTRWRYANRGFMLVGRAVRDAVGGHAADVVRFVREELFAPAGMRDATIEFDAAGTPVLASHVYASPRDWARFGLLYLHDGVAGGRRVLPEGWVRATTTPSPRTAYGSGFWLNNDAGPDAQAGRWGLPGAPGDAFFARGYLGQFVVVVPSADLVVVRLGVTHVRGGDPQAVAALVRDVVAALAPERAAAATDR